MRNTNQAWSRRTAVAAAVASTCFGPTASAARWYVYEGATGAGTGFSWGDAFTEVYSALSAASAGDEIWVAEGTYKPFPAPARGLSFIMKNGVELYGGLPVGATSLSEQSRDDYPTYLSGDQGVAGDTSDNSYTVVRAIGVGSCRLDGFVIAHGNSNSYSQPHRSAGGAIWIEDSTVILLDCLLVENLGFNGGAIYVQGDSRLVARRTDFDDNGATTGSGGAIFLEASQDDAAIPRATIERCRFVGNNAQLQGGAIDNRARLGAYSSLFSGNNAATSDGGAIHVEANEYSSLYLANITVGYNHAGGYGGGLAADTASYEVYNSIFWANTANFTAEHPHYQIDPLNMCVVEHSCIENLALLASFYCDWNDPARENFGDDPLFVDPAGSDGTIGTLDDDYRVVRSSPCVETGDKSFYPYGPPLSFTKDLAGNNRISFGKLVAYTPGTGEIDVGAHEIRGFLDRGLGELPYIDLGP